MNDMASFSFSTDVIRPSALKQIEALAQKLKHRQLIGSLATALATIKILRDVISSSKLNSFEELCLQLTEVGRYLSASAPREFVIQNMVKRVVILLREEYASALASHISTTSTVATPAIEKDNPMLLKTPLHNRLSALNPTLASLSPVEAGLSGPGKAPRPADITLRLLGQTLTSPEPDQDTELAFSKRAFILKPIFASAVTELYDELMCARENVALQAAEHIHCGEVIMTMDHSRTVQSFLEAASKARRNFTVIVAETAPTFTGRKLASELALHTPPVTTLTVSDASTFALMARCTKVVIGCHAVFADGSVLAKAGALGIARAAKAHLVPVVVVTGMYKFSPEFVRAGTDWSVADLQSPDEVLKLNDCDNDEPFYGESCGDVQVLNPYYDRVPAELVSLFITNLGGHPSSLVYRLLKDLYGTA